MTILDHPPALQPTAVVLLGGPAVHDDHGHPWTYGRVVGWLEPDTPGPDVWVHRCWEPGHGFTCHGYTHDRVLSEPGAYVMRWRLRFPPTTHHPEIELPGEN